MRFHILVFCVSIFLNSSARTADSLWQVYNNVQSADTTKLKSLVSLIKITKSFDVDSAMRLTDKLIEDAKIKKNEYYQARAYHFKGSILNQTSQHNQALKFLNLSLNMMLKLNINNKDLANLYLSIYNAYFPISNYPKALNASFNALKIFQNLNDSTGIGEAYNNIGTIYLAEDQYQQSLNYFNKSVYFKGVNNTSAASSYTNLGVVYGELNQTSTAEKYFKKALSIHSKTHNKRSIMGSYLNLSNLYRVTKSMDSALAYSFKALSIAKEINDVRSLLSSYTTISFLYNDLRQYKQALYYGVKADSILKKNQLLKFKHKVAYELATAYEGLGDLPKAIEYFKKHITYKDSLFKIENSQQLSDLKINHEIENKEIELKEKLNKEKQHYITIGIILISLFVIIIVAYLFWQQKKKLLQKHQSLLLHQKLLRAQMNPHFLSNSVGAIQSLVLTHKSIVASDYLADLMQMTRYVLESTQEEFVDFNTELKFIDNYLKMNQLLLNDSFQYQIETNNILNIKIPCAIIQPFIENSIKHGIANLHNKQGLISVIFNQKNNYIECVIKDNGVGIVKNSTSKHQSFSIKNVTERLSILTNKKQLIHLTPINIFDKEGVIVGTSVTLHIPYI